MATKEPVESNPAAALAQKIEILNKIADNLIPTPPMAPKKLEQLKIFRGRNRGHNKLHPVHHLQNLHLQMQGKFEYRYA